MTDPADLRRYMPLSVLKQRLIEAREREQRAHQERIETEQAILLHPSVHNKIRDEGTTRVDGIKIVTGYNRKWDQAILDDLRQHTSAGLFPFKHRWIEERARSKQIERMYPDHWLLIRPALTLTDKKPTITIEEE